MTIFKDGAPRHDPGSLAKSCGARRKIQVGWIACCQPDLNGPTPRINLQKERPFVDKQQLSIAIFDVYPITQQRKLFQLFVTASEVHCICGTVDGHLMNHIWLGDSIHIPLTHADLGQVQNMFDSANWGEQKISRSIYIPFCQFWLQTAGYRAGVRRQGQLHC